MRAQARRQPLVAQQEMDVRPTQRQRHRHQALERRRRQVPTDGRSDQHARTVTRLVERPPPGTPRPTQDRTPVGLIEIGLEGADDALRRAYERQFHAGSSVSMGTKRTSPTPL